MLGLLGFLIFLFVFFFFQAEDGIRDYDVTGVQTCALPIFSKLVRGYFPFSWNDDHQARIGLLNRKNNNGEINWFNINPCYFFHTVNAYEDQQGNVIVDAMRYQRLFDKDWNGPFTESPPLLTRWSLNL